MYKCKKRGFQFSNFEITKREILASISFIAIMLFIGILISGKLFERQTDNNDRYAKAVKIESADLFKYGMKTNIGDAFVYGDLIAVDPVTYPDIGGEYMYVKKVGSEAIQSTKISFLGVEFPSIKINFPGPHYIDTVKKSSHVRFVYYGVDTKHAGTIFTELKDNTITDKTPFHKDRDITATIKEMASGLGLIIFWVMWSVLIIVGVGIFFYFNNEWLE